MKQMVLMVLNNPDYCMEMLEAWAAAGAPGITILESTGLMRFRQALGKRDDMPLLPRLSDLLRGQETHHRTLFSILDDEAQTEAVLQATRDVFARFEADGLEESAVLFVLPVTASYKFTSHRGRGK